MECKTLGVTIDEQVFRVGDEVTLYFVELVEQDYGRGIRQIIARQFRIIEIHKNVITLENELGIKSSYSYWEFQKRLNKPKTTKNAQGNHVHVWDGGSRL